VDLVTDLPIENLTAKLNTLKFIRLFIDHYIQTTDYQSAGYSLGHWMGHNADLIYGSLNYRFLRGLQATVFGTVYSKRWRWKCSTAI
jgi:hypothetical protein